MICERCHRNRPLTYRSRTLGLRSICGPCIRTFDGWVRNKQLRRWDYFHAGVWRGYVTDEMITRTPRELLTLALLRRFPTLPPPLQDQPSFTCPRCGMTSYNPTDIAEGYCGNCHDFTGVEVHHE